MRKAIKSCGISKGYLWAFKGQEQTVIDKAQGRGTLTRKLQAFYYQRPSKEVLKFHYITLDKTLSNCSRLFRCNKTTIAILAKKYGLKKRTGKVSTETLKQLYIVKGLSVEKIAEQTGYSASSISTYLSKAGIRKDNRLRSTKKNSSYRSISDTVF